MSQQTTPAQSQSQSQSQSISQTQSQTASQAQSPTTSAATSSSSVLLIPATAPVGTLSITQPPQTATSFYKIAQSNFVTFGWNFSYLSVTPEHLTVAAVAGNGNTYPVGPSDGIIDGTATEVVWDVYSYQQAHPELPLAATTYTLHISDGQVTTRKPGFLESNTMLQFALYTPQGYTAIADGWTCNGCNGSVSSTVTHPAFISIVISLFVIFLSGLHLFRHGNA
ncbi:hypothetical protein BDQ17DRAFT_1246051 [Cyathus striatus]|nr:hypothetical protein BDQ17DRAFT_1246051 [Cyathus striatus]